MDLGGIHLPDDSKTILHEEKEFLANWIETMVKRWTKCIKMQYDYVEKLYVYH